MNSQSTDMIPTKASASFCDSLSDIKRTFLLFPRMPRGFVMRLRISDDLLACCIYSYAVMPLCDFLLYSCLQMQTISYTEHDKARVCSMSACLRGCKTFFLHFQLFHQCLYNMNWQKILSNTNLYLIVQSEFSSTFPPAPVTTLMVN